jgi:hypothetical protein
MARPRGGMVAVRHRAGAAKRAHFGIDLGHYQPKKAQKWPKKSQNRGFTVTLQLTIIFCIVFILIGLC